MSRLITYLTFNGNCREAMAFYQSCLGGQLDLQSIQDTPEAGLIPTGMKGFVVRAVLSKENMILMGTDMTDKPLHRGNSVSILLESDNEADIRRYYHRLSDEGHVTNPLSKNYWGAWFGGLTDKYSNHWLFHCPG